MAIKYRVGILGATEQLGSVFAQLLDEHPQFEITAMAASDRSAGKPYAEACAWKATGKMPASVRDIVVQPITPPLDCDIVFQVCLPVFAREPRRLLRSRLSGNKYSSLSDGRGRAAADPRDQYDHIGLIDRSVRIGF